ncbi:hypothetical protein [Aeromicrobium sp.]|uniref:hypothetical protein n=1 Tax=Aeromicrobium sp. TaxID=1871063 RepID=UPI0025B87D2C|nr:hypothetical protein [Aeromicrobium sp.]
MLLQFKRQGAAAGLELAEGQLLIAMLDGDRIWTMTGVLVEQVDQSGNARTSGGHISPISVDSAMTERRRTG